MMSVPCGRSEEGYNSLKFFPSGHPAITKGVMLESTQPSQMLCSPASFPPQSHFSLGAFAIAGSTGKSFSAGRKTLPQSPQYQKGMGIPNMRWREKHQSHSKPSVQSSNNCNANAGFHRDSFAAFRIFSSFPLIFMNHCVDSTSSTGFLHRSWIFTVCWSGACFSKSFSLANSSIIFPLAFSRCSPEYFPAFTSKPFPSIALITGRECCFCQTKSCLSPKVQTITQPDPNSCRTASSAITGTLLSNNGVFTRCPTIFLKRGSAGLTATATQA